MTSFHDLSIGKMMEFHRVLASAGMSKEDVESFLEDTQKAMFVVMSARIKTPVLLDLFTSHPSHGNLTGCLKTPGGFTLQVDIYKTKGGFDLQRDVPRS